jgi:hypothetical protein
MRYEFDICGEFDCQRWYCIETRNYDCGWKFWENGCIFNGEHKILNLKEPFVGVEVPPSTGSETFMKQAVQPEGTGKRRELPDAKRASVCPTDSHESCRFGTTKLAKGCQWCGRMDTKLVKSKVAKGNMECEDFAQCSSERKGVRQWNWVGGGSGKELSKNDCFKNIAEAGKT